ncbi:MAG TPA: hypothetical protein VFA46_09235 [Actinomycetes bacterium]|nr:hypothetical protein [Actinomycetes bacterium]
MAFFRPRGRQQAAADVLRDALFGGLPLEQWPPEGAQADGFPWTAFAEARAHLAAGSTDQAKRCWHEVVMQPALEPRHYLQAWHFLRAHGERPPDDIAKNVLGLIVEMGLRQGLDVLAVYADRSARYYNHAGGGVVVDRAAASLAQLIDALLAAAADIVAQIGPWEGPRPGPPPPEHVRLSFLTPSGVHFGEGAVNALEGDPLGGLVLRGATQVMRELVEIGAPNK